MGYRLHALEMQVCRSWFGQQRLRLLPHQFLAFSCLSRPAGICTLGSGTGRAEAEPGPLR